MNARPLLLIVIFLSVGCILPGAMEASPAPDSSGATEPWKRIYAFDGQRGPDDTPARFTFLVPASTAQIEAMLTWNQPAAALAFRLLDAGDQEMAAGWQETPTRAYVTNTHPVTPGEWTLEITSDRAVVADFSATVILTSDAPATGPLDLAFMIPPRSPTRDLPVEARALIPTVIPRDYAEVNLNMVPDDAFRFSWNASAPVYFNVHYHGENETERPIEERATTLAGEFTATATEVYALLWRNEGNTNVEITLQLDGNYRVHSMTRKA